jgi:hypothetical protein
MPPCLLVLTRILSTGFTAFLVFSCPFGISGLHFSFDSVDLTFIRTEPKDSAILGLHKSRASTWLNILSTERTLLSANHS